MLKSNDEVKFLIKIGYKNEDELEKEIDWLLDYFKISDFDSKFLLIDDIKLLIKKKSIFSTLSGILKLFDIYKEKLIINQEDISLQEEMTKNKNNLKENKDISIDEIHQININLEKKFELTDENKKIFFKLLIAIDQYPESIKFIKDKKFEEVNNLVQFLLESDDTHLSEKDINDFINVVKLFEEIISEIKGQNAILIQFLCKILKKIIYDKTLEKGLFNYIEKYNHIQTLFNDYLKHSEGCIKKIEKILIDSSFNISRDESNLKPDNYSYTIQGSFNDPIQDIKIEKLELFRYKSKKYQPIFYKDLEVLFQRVYISKVPQQYEASADLYIKFFKYVKRLINLFNSFYTKGFQEAFEVNIDFKEKQIICSYKNHKKDIDLLIFDCEHLNLRIEKILNKAYNNFEALRFFYGRHISFIFKNIINKKDREILDILRASFGNIFEECTLTNVSYTVKEEDVVKKYSKDINFIYNLILIKKILKIFLSVIRLLIKNFQKKKGPLMKRILNQKIYIKVFIIIFPKKIRIWKY